MKVLLTHIIPLLTSITLTAQPITWQMTYGDGNIDYGNSIVQTPDAGYIAVGEKRVGTVTYAYAMRLGNFGDTIWTKLFNGVEARSIVRTSDESYIITTLSLMIKIDILGNIIWQVPVFSKKIVPGLYGEILVIQDLILRKYSSHGNIVWSRDFSNTIDGYFVDIAVNSANELVLVGNLNNSTTGNRFVLRTNLDGIEMSNSIFFWTVNPAYVIPVEKNGFVLSGSWTPRLAMFDSSGSIVWDSSYSVALPEHNATFHIIKTFDDGFALAGYYRNGNYDYYVNLLKIDSKGNKSWSRIFGFGDHDEGRFVQQTSDSGFIIIGFRDNFNLGDIYVIKTDKTGYASPPLAINNPEYEGAMAKFNLYPNYPNPFNPFTIITYDLPNSGFVALKVYDMLGREVKILVNEMKTVGLHRAQFTAEELASGAYFYRLSVSGNAGEFVAVRKCVVVK